MKRFSSNFPTFYQTNRFNKFPYSIIWTVFSSILKLWSMSFNFLLKDSPYFSFEFKPGKNNRRNNRRCPISLIIFSNILFLNHSSKNSLFIVSLYIILPISALPIFPATRFILEYLNPLFFPSIDIPLLLQPYSR